MKLTTRAKEAALSLGLYRPARALQRLLSGDSPAPHRALFSQFIKPGDLAFDVGANIGDRTDAMLSVGARVVAFEPQPKCAREVRARAGSDRLTVVESAMGSQVGQAELHLTSTHGWASLRPDWQRSDELGTMTVPVTTLDAEIARHGKPIFCKIDVEGYEAEVLKGLSTPVQALSLEFHCHSQGVGKVQECLMLLSKLGSYEFNITAGETAELLLPDWISMEALASSFPNCASPHPYGDIFARRTS